jgi:hypothetical protein
MAGGFYCFAARSFSRIVSVVLVFSHFAWFSLGELASLALAFFFLAVRLARS